MACQLAILYNGAAAAHCVVQSYINLGFTNSVSNKIAGFFRMTSGLPATTKSPISIAMESRCSIEKTCCEVCFYITGHGLGHATRSLELIRILLDSGSFNVHVVTEVSADFFWSNLTESNLKKYSTGKFSHSCRALDTGASQLDVFTVDAANTLQRYYDKIEVRRDDLISFEVNWLRKRNIQLVLVDATPLGCEAGRQAGAVTILISNFSWDFCYREMLSIANSRGQLNPEQCTLYESMVRQCEADSSACSYYLQLPGATPLPRGFDTSKLAEGPLIARGLRGIVTRADLGLPLDVRILLVGFGGHSAAWGLQDSFLPAGWACLVLGASAADMPSARFQALSPSVYVPDLIHLADAVLGKLGYGFVSECLTMGTPLIYVPRQYWPEEQYLEALLTVEHNAGVRMSREDFFSGRWEPYISEAAALEGGWEKEDLSAAQAGQTILRFLSSVINPRTMAISDTL